MNIVIVQCTKSKRSGEWPAKMLYDESDYFRKQRAYGEAYGDYWFIQSAEYGLVHPEEMIESYDTHADDIEDPEGWGKEIADELDSIVEPQATIELLGGASYTDPLTPELERNGFEVIEPLRGMGIGERKEWIVEKVKYSNTESLCEYINNSDE